MIASINSMMQLLNDPDAAVDRLRQIEARTHSSGVAEAQATVDAVLEAVKQRGDAALKDYTERFDGVQLDSLRVDSGDVEAAWKSAPLALRDALQLAHRRITQS